MNYEKAFELVKYLTPEEMNDIDRLSVFIEMQMSKRTMKQFIEQSTKCQSISSFYKAKLKSALVMYIISCLAVLFLLYDTVPFPVIVVGVILGYLVYYTNKEKYKKKESADIVAEHIKSLVDEWRKSA